MKLNSFCSWALLTFSIYTFCVESGTEEEAGTRQGCCFFPFVCLLAGGHHNIHNPPGGEEPISNGGINPLSGGVTPRIWNNKTIFSINIFHSCCPEFYAPSPSSVQPGTLILNNVELTLSNSRSMFSWACIRPSIFKNIIADLEKIIKSFPIMLWKKLERKFNLWLS